MTRFLVMSAENIWDKCARDEFSTLTPAISFFGSCEGMECRELYSVAPGGRMTLLADQDFPDVQVDEDGDPVVRAA